jgi:hypothetical protein
LDCNPVLTLTEVTDRIHFPAPPMLTRYLKRSTVSSPWDMVLTMVSSIL